jgi:hypothetical protein
VGLAIPAVTTNGALTLRFAGVPGYPYDLQRSTNLTDWATILSTNAPSKGLWIYTDGHPPQPSAYYRVRQQ